METRPLLYGIVGFILGGLLVSIAASATDKPATKSGTSDVTMSQAADSLKSKQGDDYDRAFLGAMIAHHQGAIDMAELSAASAKHEEVKSLSKQIISAQKQEITAMQQWQIEWGYTSSSSMTHSSH